MQVRNISYARGYTYSPLVEIQRPVIYGSTNVATMSMNYRFVSGKKKRELIMFKIYFENSYDYVECD